MSQYGEWGQRSWPRLAEEDGDKVGKLSLLGSVLGGWHWAEGVGVNAEKAGAPPSARPAWVLRSWSGEGMHVSGSPLSLLSHHTQPVGGHGRAAGPRTALLTLARPGRRRRMTRQIPSHLQPAQETKALTESGGSAVPGTHGPGQGARFRREGSPPHLPRNLRPGVWHRPLPAPGHAPGLVLPWAPRLPASTPRSHPPVAPAPTQALC